MRRWWLIGSGMGHDEAFSVQRSAFSKSWGWDYINVEAVFFHFQGVGWGLLI